MIWATMESRIMSKSIVYVGIDLHKNSLTVCVMNGHGGHRFDTLPTKYRNRIVNDFLELERKHRVLATLESVGFYH